MLQRPDFDSKDIDPDLHQRMAKVLMMVALSALTCGRVLWVWFVWVCTVTSLVHTGMYWYKQSFSKNMRADVYLTLNYSRWYWECGTSIWWYPSMIIVPPSPYTVHVGTYQFVNMFWMLQGWGRNSSPSNCGVHRWKLCKTQDSCQADLRNFA